MRWLHSRNVLWIGLLLAPLSFPLPYIRAQNQVLEPRSLRGWLDPTVKDEYKNWLKEDVAWIAKDQERADFKKLLSDKQRDAFVVAFWERRNPTPGAAENKFKEEHYRRLAYANEHFAASVAGWRTDRGRIYVVYGPPDSVNRRPATAIHEPNGIQTSRFPYEDWHYGNIEGDGRDITIEFVDTCRCGEYHLTGSSPFKD